MNARYSNLIRGRTNDEGDQKEALSIPSKNHKRDFLHNHLLPFVDLLVFILVARQQWDTIFIWFIIPFAPLGSSHLEV